MHVFIVMPAHNEGRTVASVVRRAKKYGNVIVIDDFSSDNTGKEAKKAGAIVVTHNVNKGLGSSLRTGFNEAVKRGADVVITIDADGQHRPEEIPKLMEKIHDGYDFVLGTRDLTKYPFIKKFGNFFLNFATNFISGTDLKDTESGFRAIRAEKLKKFYLKSQRYEIAVEIIFEVGRNNLKTASVPVNSSVYVKGVGFYDGVKNFTYLLHRRERTWRSYIEDTRYVLKKFF